MEIIRTTTFVVLSFKPDEYTAFRKFIWEAAAHLKPVNLTKDQQTTVQDQLTQIIQEQPLTD